MRIFGIIAAFIQQCWPIIIDTGDKLAGISGISLSKIWTRLRRSGNYTPDKLRNQLLELTQHGINERLRQALHQDIQIPLFLESQHQQVGQEQPSLIQPDLTLNRRLVNLVKKVWSDRELKPQETLFDVFEDKYIRQRLLILGAPGSGKTTELLNLAKHLCQQAEQDESARVPIILELSSWDGQPITDWAVKEINRLYEFRLPADSLQQGITDGDFLLLLDGLDELGTSQDDCIQAINKFIGQDNLRRLVVCCRRENYESSPLQLDGLNGAVYIEPLKNSQIRNYFQQLNCPSQWNHVKRDSALLDLARKPLFLHMLAILTDQETPIRNQTELFDAYIEKKFNDVERQFKESGKRFTSRQQTRRYLTWIARQLERTGETEFYIEDLQPTWLQSRRQLTYYTFIVGWSIGTTYWLLFWPLAGFWPSLFFGLVMGCILAYVSSIVGIQRVEQLDFSISGGLRGGIIGALSIGLLMGIFGGINILRFDGPIVGLAYGLTYFLVFGLFSGLVSALFWGLQVRPREKKRPNEGIYRTLCNMCKIAFLCLFFIGLPSGLLIGASTGQLIDGLKGFYGTALFSLGYGFPALQHFILRVQLTINKIAPWHYERFLNQAADLRFIQHTRGRYRFMHDLLRKHFADLKIPASH